MHARTQNERHQGYTLIELLVVCFIMIMVAALAVTEYRKQVPDALLDRAALQMVADIADARMQAISLSTSVTIGFTPGSREYTVWTDADRNNERSAGEVVTNEVDASISLYVEAGTSVTYTSRGNLGSSAGTTVIRLSATGTSPRYIYILKSGHAQWSRRSLTQGETT